MASRPKDIVSKRKRSEMMRRVGQRLTPLETRVAALLRGMGHRFRTNNGNLPGTPDLSNRSRGWAIFVNGCFWHGHKNCAKTKSGIAPRVPARNRRFWSAKIAGNRSRDARKCRDLRRMGMRVLIVWECQLRAPEAVTARLRPWFERRSIEHL